MAIRLKVNHPVTTDQLIGLLESSTLGRVGQFTTETVLKK